MVGKLAEKRAAGEQGLQGLLVRRGAQDSLMHPSDLPYFTKLHPGRVLQRQLLALHKPFSEVIIFPSPSPLPLPHPPPSPSSFPSSLPLAPAPLSCVVLLLQAILHVLAVCCRSWSEPDAVFANLKLGSERVCVGLLGIDVVPGTLA